MTEAKELLALDVGMARTGIARASSIAKIAEPLKTVDTEHLHEELAKLLTDDVSAIVVGLPRSLGGEDSEQTKWVRDWAGQAKSRYKIPLYFQDETLSTQDAATKMKQAGKNYDIDSAAAAVILQDFLQVEESERQLV